MGALVAFPLRNNLLQLAHRYMKRTGAAMSSLSKMAHSDSGFFANLEADRVSFTARKYDQILIWFFRHWPAGYRWPISVPLPTESEARQVERRTNQGAHHAQEERPRHPAGKGKRAGG